MLGPLDVMEGGAPITLGAPKERSLLALLAVHRNEVVSTDRLVDELWPAGAPDQAVAAVRVYISHLRKVLPDGRLVTKGKGYELRLDDDELDAARFDRLVVAGRHALTRGQATDAAEAFRSALGLFRGAPLADIERPPAVDAEVVRLSEARLAALEARLDADLECGRHREVVEELSALVGEHPLRERLWGQLMLALYRCGRQADALRAYQHARATLIDALGIEPGAELRALEAAMLNQDPSLGGPPPAPVEVRNNLPSSRTAFIGREREVAHVVELVRSARLVTLTGVGGCGKTRLAVEAARGVMAEFADGVFLVELAAISDPLLVTAAVVAALGLDTRNVSTSVEQHLADFLSRRRMLVVLDNCEHVIDAVAALADIVLARGESSVLLATSRENLEVEGERAWRVPSLSTEGGTASDAVALFVERARIARADFALGPGDDHVVEQICHRLDGMPLAIELAAARLRMLSVQQIAARLDDRFRLLTGGGRSVLPRQQTLEATMDWSYQLLDEDDRVLLARLGVFVGGFTIEAVEAVCGGSLDALARLVDKSLVVVGDDRYRLLETVRQYALGKLLATGEIELLRTRHRDWFLELVRPYDARICTAEWESLLMVEFDNLRAAYEWSVEHRDREPSLVLAARIGDNCNRVGRFLEARELLQLVAPLLDGATDELALHVRGTAAAMAWRLGDGSRAVRELDEILEIAREAGAIEIIMDQAYVVAILAAVMGDCDRADALIDEGMAAQHQVGRTGLDWFLYARAFVAMLRGDLAASRAAHEPAIDEARATGNAMLLVTGLVNQARVVALMGEPDLALDLAHEAIETAEAFPHLLLSLDWMITIASAATIAGRFQEARRWSRVSIEGYQRMGGTITLGEAIAIEALARPDGEPETIATLLGAATGPGSRPGDFGPRMHAADIEKRRAELEAEMGSEALAAAWDRGAQMTLDDAVTFALSLPE